MLKVLVILAVIAFLFWLTLRTPPGDKHVKP